MTDKLHGKNLRIWIFALLGGIVFAAFDRCGYMIQHPGSVVYGGSVDKLFAAELAKGAEHRFWCWFAEERIAGQHSATDCHGKVFGIIQCNTEHPCLHKILASVFYKLLAGISGRLPGSVCGRCAQSDRLDLLRLADGSSSAAPYGHFMRYFQYDQSFWME